MPVESSDAAATSKLTLTLPSEREVLMTRVFEAPRALLFEAHTRPEHLRLWWGPRRYALTACDMDFRPGGAYRFVQRGEDGVEHAFRGVYREIVPPERLVFTFEYEGTPGRVAVETLTFAERDGLTTLTSRLVFDSKADRDAMLAGGMEEGASETWDRLADHLLTMAAPRHEIVVSRVFDAPREMVWEAWTDPKQVAQWWGPEGFTTTIETMDVRPGGVWKHVMRGPDGTSYPNLSVFKEVARPERIVYSHGGGREGGPGARFDSTWTFESLGKNKTRLTIRMIFATAAERDRVVEEFGAVEGGRQTLGRLADYLIRRR